MHSLVPMSRVTYEAVAPMSDDGWLSHFLSRILPRHLLQWSASVLERVTQEAKEGQEGFSTLSFLVIGVMSTLAALFKQGHRCAAKDERSLGLESCINPTLRCGCWSIDKDWDIRDGHETLSERNVCAVGVFLVVHIPWTGLVRRSRNFSRNPPHSDGA